jgi:hypothetical protein
MSDYNEKEKLSDDEKRIEACIGYLAESTAKLRALSITMRQTQDNMQANMAYELWLREMQRFEYLSSQLKQVAMGAHIPPFY